MKVNTVIFDLDGTILDSLEDLTDSVNIMLKGESYPLRKRKPAPDNVYEVMRLLEAEKDRTIFVGDSNVDVQTAKNADLVCVGVTWGFRSKEVLMAEGADFIIDEPSMLLEIIK